MDALKKPSAAASLLRQRNFSYLVVAVLAVSNFGLIAKLLTSNDKTIIIPNLNEPSKAYSFDGEHINDVYFSDWACSHLSQLLTANPKNFKRKRELFVRWSLSSSGLEHDLEKTEKELKRDNISTAFYPESFVVNRADREVEVTGSFLTYFGASRKSVSKEKTFVLGWKILNDGKVAIETLKEKINEKI